MARARIEKECMLLEAMTSLGGDLKGYDLAASRAGAIVGYGL